MQLWEYHTEYLKDNLEVVKPAGDNGLSTESLNKIGQGGWELINLVPVNHMLNEKFFVNQSTYIGLFKRPAKSVAEVLGGTIDG